MIEHIRGKLLSIAGEILIVECAGLGLRVRVNQGTRFRNSLGRRLVLPAWLDLQPRRFQLYGFTSGTERDRFVSLISIPGIGPATAMRLLGHYEELVKGGAMPTIPGLGPAKQARVGKWIRRHGGFKPSATAMKELRQALRSLGMQAAQAEKAAIRALAAAPGAGIQELLRLAVRRR